MPYTSSSNTGIILWTAASESKVTVVTLNTGLTLAANTVSWLLYVAWLVEHAGLRGKDRTVRI